MMKLYCCMKPGWGSYGRHLKKIDHTSLCLVFNFCVTDKYTKYCRIRNYLFHFLR